MTVRRNCVPVAPLRERFNRSPLSLADVASLAGYHKAHVGRILAGHVQYVYRNGERREVERRSVSIETAARLCRAMHVDPVEVGL